MKISISSQATLDAALNFDNNRRIIAMPVSTVKNIKASPKWRLESGEMLQRVAVIFSEAIGHIKGQLDLHDGIFLGMKVG